MGVLENGLGTGPCFRCSLDEGQEAASGTRQEASDGGESGMALNASISAQ